MRVTQRFGPNGMLSIRSDAPLSHLRDRVPEFQGSPMRAPVSVCPLPASDAAPARALADAVLGDAPYAATMLAPLDAGLRSASDEYRVIVAREPSGLRGLIVFGETAGAVGAGRIYFVAVDAAARRRGIASALIGAACRDLQSRGVRFVAMEIVEEPRLEAARALAARAGFYREGVVRDYVRDGMGLALFRRDFGDA